MKYNLNDENIGKIKRFCGWFKILFVIVFLLYLFSPQLTSLFFFEEKKYSLIIHPTLNMRYKTPANNFPVFVERNFLEKYDYDMRSSILKSAEKEKIIKSEEECSSDKGKIEDRKSVV